MPTENNNELLTGQKTEKPTEKLFQQDVYQKECTASVIEVIADPLEKSMVLILDRTIFFPTGGGQPCDLGLINNVPVTEVYEKAGVVYHKLECSNSDGLQDSKTSPESYFKPGDTVNLKLDWNRRFDHMQRHCGEHILSGIFFQELGGINRGFHMGEDYMTIDIDVKEITWEQAMKVELLANQAIWANLPVTTRFFQSREEAENLPLRKALALDEDIIIVCVGDEANAADCVACCGTHPSTSGQVGIIKILKLESYKGMTRIYFKAGQEAYLDYQNKSNILIELNKKYSSDDQTLIGKIKIQDEKNKSVRQELYSLKTAVLAQYAEELNEMLSDITLSSKSGGNRVLVQEYSYLKVDDLLHLGRQVSPQIKGLLMLVSPQENTVLLFSGGKIDCGKLVRENAGIYNGKGGGNTTNARAIFTKSEYLETFIDLIQKHLR